MAYTFDPELPTDKDRVRYEIGDVDTDEMYLHDETIVAILGIMPDIGNAIVNCARAIANQLRRPDFSLDWLTVEEQVLAAESYDRMADKKAAALGVGGFNATIEFPVRRDAYWPTDID